MPTTFEKLNLKDQTEIVVLDAPLSFEPELASLHGVTVHRSIQRAGKISFALAFVTQQDKLDQLSNEIIQHSSSDAVVWFAYPKGTSKKYKCGFNRDSGWHVLKSAGFDTVRAVAIDEDWSAIRFRRTEFIKNSIRRRPDPPA